MKEILHEFPRALGELKRVTGATEFHFADIYAGQKEFAKEKVGLQVRLALFPIYGVHLYDLRVADSGADVRP
jgi:hypothetical protein